jgi:hypothetical protein
VQERDPHARKALQQPQDEMYKKEKKYAPYIHDFMK